MNSQINVQPRESGREIVNVGERIEYTGAYMRGASADYLPSAASFLFGTPVA